MTTAKHPEETWANFSDPTLEQALGRARISQMSRESLLQHQYEKRVHKAIERATLAK
jgi:hypothetical protein